MYSVGESIFFNKGFWVTGLDLTSPVASDSYDLATASQNHFFSLAIPVTHGCTLSYSQVGCNMQAKSSTCEEQERTECTAQMDILKEDKIKKLIYLSCFKSKILIHTNFLVNKTFCSIFTLSN